MTIKEMRTQAVSKLTELGKIKKPVYSARDLHQKRAMLSRVQRQEQRRYMRQVMTRKVKLRKDIVDIDKYLQSVSDYDAYLAGLPKGRIKDKGKNSIKAVSLPTAPEILPAPNIVFGKRLVVGGTRLPRYAQRAKQRGKY